MLSDSGPDWRAALYDDRAFAAEQRRLRQIWTFVGMTSELPRHNDWLRANLWGQSIFVQNFGGTLRGFKNSCVHRHFPIRTTDRGNGTVQCPFHHWTYDGNGRLTGIPMSKDLFGTSPKGMDTGLEAVAVETCGSLIFARLPDSNSQERLADFLGPAAPILALLSAGAYRPDTALIEMAANWRLSVHMTLDDYHLVAVHPSTFGKDGYLKADLPRYYRFGAHSSYFTEGDEGELHRMSEECAARLYTPRGYRIFSIFPNLSVIQVEAMYRWYIAILQHRPLARDRTAMRATFFPAPFWRPKGQLDRITDPLQAPIRAMLYRHYFHRILNEDKEICERHQTVVGPSRALPRLGAHEERIAWFEDTYRDLAGHPAAPSLAAVRGKHSFGHF